MELYNIITLWRKSKVGILGGVDLAFLEVFVFFFIITLCPKSKVGFNGGVDLAFF